MSWWDTSGFSNLASQALKNAQKKIDKVLDIEEKTPTRRTGLPPSKKVAKKDVDASQEETEDGDFWSGWLGTGGKKTTDENDASSSHSSWGIPWNVTSGHSSESADASESSRTSSDITKTLENKVEESNLHTPSETVILQNIETEPAAAADDKINETKLDISNPGSSHVFTAADIQGAVAEQTDILVSDSFATGWQDFQMDDDEPVEGEDISIDSADAKPEASDYENSQNLSENRLHSSVESNVASLEPETSGQTVICSENLLVLGIETGKKDDLISSTNEDTFVSYRSNLNISFEDTTSESLKNSIPSAEEIISADNNCQPIENLKELSENYIPVASKEINVGDVLSETLSTSSFTVVSEETTTMASVLQSPDLQNEILSATLVTNEQADVTESTETTDLDFNSTSAIFAKNNLDEETVSALSDASQGFEIPDIKDDSLNLQKSGTDHPETAEFILPEILMSSDIQKCQSEFMQDYVNISTSSDGGQTGSLDGSAILSDDLRTSTDMEMGNSRTSSDLDLPAGGRTSSTGSSDTSKFDSSIDTVVDRSTLDSQSDVDLMEKEPPYSLFGDNQPGGGEVGTTELSQSGHLNDSSQSLSSSYVKCMIEEAMEDLSKTEDSGSDHHSSGEKSESSKVDSELEKSIYSGHESSDEIETTTSSDIEIISAPTPNGDSKYHVPFDLSPLKIVLQRSGREQGLNRSDSQSSSSKGEIDRLSPERGEGSSWRDEEFHHHDLHAVREEGADNPSHPERLLKKLAEMAEVLQARENKLVQLSKENHQLTEDNNILRNQLIQSEQAREEESADVTALTNEFTARIGEAEKKIQAAIKEKEILKQKLTSAEKELARRSGDTDLQALLEEKREQVEELLKEGEKLSKQQLQSSTIIKKLRAKEKESDTTIAAQKKKLDEQTKELERLTAVLDSKEEMEKKQNEAIMQLNAAVQRQEKELIKYKSEMEDAQEKCRGLQAALDNSYKEIAELHRSNASQDSKAQEAALSAETQVREELKAAMEREQQRFRQEREAFIMQIDDLRLDLARLEKEHSRREDLLRQEITHLQERLQQDEARNQDLTQSVTSATRPLLRQIENLQATLGAQSAAWERVEKNLTDRLAEAQTALAMAQEKERTANDHVMELTARAASLEAANSRIKQEKAQLAVQVESDKSRLEELQDIRNSALAQLEASKQKLTQELTQLKMDKVYLESQLNVERTRLENERKKSLALEEQLRQAAEQQQRGTPSPSPSMSVSRQESIAGSMYERQSPGNLSWSFHDDNETVTTFGGAKTSVYESLRQSGATVVFENLSSQLKMREGEITHMQSEISQLERTRESMARELVNLTNQNEELLEMKIAHEQLLEQFNELNSRYSAILQMYGEKEEQVQELRLDLQDVKEMYKTQIDALLAK